MREDALMDASGCVLVVDDETNMRRLLRSALQKSGFAVLEAADGTEAMSLLRTREIDVALVDVMLPGVDGLELVRRIRGESAVPIILITARGEESSRVAGLEVGADDYVVKPFSTQELLARVRALLRRIELDRQAALTPGVPSIRQESVTHGPLRVDPAARIATLDDAPLDLTPKEFDLLLLFVSHPNRAFSRAFLLEQLWSDDFDRVDRVVDSHITRLRKKLGDFGERIVTVWSVGYRFEP